MRTEEGRLSLKARRYSGPDGEQAEMGAGGRSQNTVCGEVSRRSCVQTPPSRSSAVKERREGLSLREMQTLTFKFLPFDHQRNWKMGEAPRYFLTKLPETASSSG